MSEREFGVLLLLIVTGVWDCAETVNGSLGDRGGSCRETTHCSAFVLQKSLCGNTYFLFGMHERLKRIAYLIE